MEEEFSGRSRPMVLLPPELAEFELLPPALPQAAMVRAIETAAVPMTTRRIIAFMVGGASLTEPQRRGEVEGVKPATPLDVNK
ncbi:hypothetical protein GCM10010442_24900 [Kitasatospora kifunensis]